MSRTLTPTPTHPETTVTITRLDPAHPLWLGGPTLTVIDEETGHPLSLPVATVEVGGAHYLVSPDGETDWVRDLRAAGEAILRRGRTGEPIEAREISGGEHDRVVAAYRDQMGERTSEPFDALPDPADHPVFRIEPHGAHLP